MPSTTVSKSVAIIVGFTEGKWHARRLEKALRARGHTVVSDFTNADVIFAHSGGCYSVPLNLKPHQLVMLVNPTYWPGRSVPERGRVMVQQALRLLLPGYHPLYHFWKALHNVCYFFWHAGQNLAIIRHAPRYNLEQELQHKHTILVRNQDDPWLTPDFRDLQAIHPHLQVIELPGDHADCWLHPDRYIDLLELEVKES